MVDNHRIMWGQIRCNCSGAVFNAVESSLAGLNSIISSKIGILDLGLT